MDSATRAAFERLLTMAKSDTGQSRIAADFLLAWWNAEVQGGFDLADLFAVDRAVARDMAVVVDYIASRDVPEYPDDYRADIEAVIHRWRAVS